MNGTQYLDNKHNTFFMLSFIGLRNLDPLSMEAHSTWLIILLPPKGEMKNKITMKELILCTCYIFFGPNPIIRLHMDLLPCKSICFTYVCCCSWPGAFLAFLTILEVPYSHHKLLPFTFNFCKFETYLWISLSHFFKLPFHGFVPFLKQCHFS